MAEPLRIRFGDYELDEVRNELRGGGSRVEFQQKRQRLDVIWPQSPIRTLRG